MTDIYIDKLIDAIEKLAIAASEDPNSGCEPIGYRLVAEVLKTMAELKEFRKPRD